MGRLRVLLPSLLALLPGCGPSVGDTDGGASAGSGTGSDTASTSDAPPTADSTGGGIEGGSLGMDHGVVTLELGRDTQEVDDPFVGTARVEVTLLYLECLIDFYDANPSWQQDGVDGSVVFDAALATGLCDPADPTLIECSVAGFTQELDTGKMLTVRYDVTGPLEDRQLRFGPLPTQELAACPAGGLPIVRISSGAVRGFDAAGAMLWALESFQPPEGATDQGAVLRIRVARS